MTREVFVVDVLGVQRSLIVHWGHVGDTVLVVLHGSTENKDGSDDPLYPAARFENNYDSSYFATHRSRGYTQMYLAAQLKDGWFCWQNAGEEFGTCSQPDDGSDAAFVQKAVELSGANQSYLFGMSGGAKMAWKLHCAADGVGVVGGALAPSLRTIDNACGGPAVAFHGADDPYVDVEAADDTAAWWIASHGCGDDATISSGFNDIDGCSTPGRLAYYRLEGVGHTIPGAPFVWDGLGGISSYDSLAAMWDVWDGNDPAPLLGGATAGAAPRISTALLPALAWLFFR